MGKRTSSASGNVSQGRVQGLSSRPEGSSRPSAGLETPAGNALHSVGARAPIEEAVSVVVLGWASRLL